MHRVDVFTFDENYTFFRKSVENARNPRSTLRGILEDYLSVWLPLGLRPGEKLLDVGSNIGTLGHFLKYTNISTLGIDLNWDAVRAGKEIYGHERRNMSIVADGRSLPFKSSSFDVIVSQDVFEHLPDGESAILMLGEMNRVLKPNKDRMLHKITVLDDTRHIHEDKSHYIKWTTEEWGNFFSLRGWKVLGNPTRHFPLINRTLYGNFLMRRAA